MSIYRRLNELHRQKCNESSAEQPPEYDFKLIRQCFNDMPNEARQIRVGAHTIEPAEIEEAVEIAFAPTIKVYAEMMAELEKYSSTYGDRPTTFFVAGLAPARNQLIQSHFRKHITKLYKDIFGKTKPHIEFADPSDAA